MPWWLEKHECCTYLQKGKKEDTSSYKALSLASVPEKIMEQILMEGTCGYMMDKVVSKKACLDLPKINQSQYNKSTWTRDKKSAYAIYLDFSKLVYSGLQHPSWQAAKVWTRQVGQKIVDNKLNWLKGG